MYTQFFFKLCMTINIDFSFGFIELNTELVLIILIKLWKIYIILCKYTYILYMFAIL